MRPTGQQISGHFPAAGPAIRRLARWTGEGIANSRQPADALMSSTLEATPKRGRCLQVVVKLSRNYKFLTCVCLLTILDASLVVMELIVDLLEIRAAEASLKRESEHSSTNCDNMATTVEASTPQSSDATSHEDDHHHIYGTIASVSRFGSIGILSLMVMWNILRLVALRMLFFKSKLQVVDGGVVLISLVLDVVFLPNLVSGVDKTLVAVVGLTWRIVRVVNNSLVLLHEMDHIQVKRYMHQAKSSWKRCLLLKREVFNLRNLCRKSGVSESTISDSKTAARLHYMRHKNQSTTQSALVQCAALPVLYVLGDPASDVFYDNPEDEDDVNYKTSQMTVQCLHCTTIQRQMEERRAQLPPEWRLKLTRPQAAELQQRLSNGQRQMPASHDGGQPKPGRLTPVVTAAAADVARTARTLSTSDGQKGTKAAQPVEGLRKGRFISVRANLDASSSPSPPQQPQSQPLPPRERDLGDGLESDIAAQENFYTRL